MVKKTLRKDGIRGVYKGWVLSITMYIPYRIFYFGPIAIIKKKSKRIKKNVVLQFLVV